jgi:hypothetical protein
VVSSQDPDGTELVLEPSSHPAVKPFKDALVADGIPFTSFAVDDVKTEYERLRGLGAAGETLRGDVEPVRPPKGAGGASLCKRFCNTVGREE